MVIPGSPSAVTIKRHNDGVRKHLEHASGLMSKIIHIKVGDRKKPFQVHRDVLCSSSPFFRKACNGPWKERDGWIDMPEDQPETFETYVQWLYLKAITKEIPEKEPLHETFHDLVKCFVLGDKLLDITFKNAVIDALLKVIKVHHTYPRSQATYIYQHLPRSSTLRRLYVDIWAWKCKTFWFILDDCYVAPREFFKDLAMKQLEIRDRRYHQEEDPPWVTNPCQYHEHPEGTPKCSKDLQQ